MAKKISITLEQILAEETTQKHDLRSYTTEVKPLPTTYKITKMRNAAVIDWGHGKRGLKLRVSDVITEAEADELARCQVFDVTIES